MSLLFLIPFFVIGAFVGSFLGVLVNRIPKGKNFITGRSVCDFCNKTLEWNDLIPVISYLLLKGKCRYCHFKLSIFYPVIEILSGVIFALAFLYFPTFNPEMFYYLFVFSALIVIFFTDLKYGIIPDKILLPMSLIVLFWVFISKRGELLGNLLMALFASAFFIAISLLYYFIRGKIAMGGGDIKFAFFMGLFLGFPNTIVALYIAFLTAALYSIILIIWRKKAFLKDSIPFGPFLVIGVFISVFLGNYLWQKALVFLGLL